MKENWDICFILFCLSLNRRSLGLSLWLWSSLRLSGALTHRRAVLCKLLAKWNELGGARDVFTEGLGNIHTLLPLATAHCTGKEKKG